MRVKSRFPSLLVVSEIFVLLLLALQEDSDVGVETLQLPGLHLVLEAVEAVLEVPLCGSPKDPDPLLVDWLLLVLDHCVPCDLLLVAGDLELLFVNPS